LRRSSANRQAIARQSNTAMSAIQHVEQLATERRGFDQDLRLELHFRVTVNKCEAT